MAYRIGRQWWCKKEGNKGLIRRENGIVLYFAHKQHNVLQVQQHNRLIASLHSNNLATIWLLTTFAVSKQGGFHLESYCEVGATFIQVTQ